MLFTNHQNTSASQVILARFPAAFPRIIVAPMTAKANKFVCCVLMSIQGGGVAMLTGWMSIRQVETKRPGAADGMVSNGVVPATL